MQLKPFNKEANVAGADLNREYIPILAEHTFIRNKVTDGIRDSLLNKIESAPERYTSSGMLNSMIKGLFLQVHTSQE